MRILLCQCGWRLHGAFAVLMVAGALVPRLSAQAATELTPSSFQATGLAHEANLRHLYEGEFRVAFERTSFVFRQTLMKYMLAFGQLCPGNVVDPVEITEPTCVKWVDTMRGRIPVGKECVRYVDEGIGVYANCRLWDALISLDPQTVREALSRNSREMGRDPWGALARSLRMAESLKSEMKTLVQTNGCTSPALKRLEENLVRFARDEPPIRLSGSAPLPPPLAAPPAGNQSYATLLDDLITSQASAWTPNRYVRRSVTNVNVTMRDAAGRPAVVNGAYLYSVGRDNGANRRTGLVRLTFSDGLPNCMYFNDAPNTCRKAAYWVVERYAQGRYRTQ
jgi:hypothetical protein